MKGLNMMDKQRAAFAAQLALERRWICRYSIIEEKLE